MAKIKNQTGEDRLLPWLGDRLVLAGQVVDVPDEDIYAYTQQEGWDPADDTAQVIHDDASRVDEAIADVVSGVAEEPAGNASRELWAAYVVGSGQATSEQLEELSRDEIRDTYKEQA